MSDISLVGGCYGSDHRGASVSYSKFGVDYWITLVSQTSFQFFVDFDFYCAFFFWDTMWQESLAIGKCLAGRLLVLDLSDITIAKAKRALDFGGKQTAGWPGKEHPQPEGLHTTLICNVPWMVMSLWSGAKRLLPANDAAKVKLFKAGDPAFMIELLKHVAIDQVPPMFGGQSTEVWPYTNTAEHAKGPRHVSSMFGWRSLISPPGSPRQSRSRSSSQENNTKSDETSERGERSSRSEQRSEAR